ncbi:MAG: stage II sporulation protein M [Proteobacteria bacterium]|nr:stage II sporulation protein M [Pseudomonadota bacterium]
MAEPEAHLRSYNFRREREDGWRDLDSLVQRVQRSGLANLSAQELRRLPELYRSVISSLSVARSISLDRNVVAYLESLSVRAYFCVYGGRESLGAGIRRFAVHDFPAAVRAARWFIAAAFAVLAFGAVVGFVLTMNSPDWYYSFVSDSMAGSRSPTAETETLRAALYDSDDTAIDSLNLFASFLFSHNAKIGLLSFALGFAFGVPTVLLLFVNGLTLGAFAALYASRGLSWDLWAWLMIHGTTELLALALCGGAGLVLGGALAFPDRYSRLHNLGEKGRMAAVIAIGAVGLFFVAALLEGFARQIVTDGIYRYGIGGGVLLAWLAYFALSGRKAGHGRD